MIVPFGSTTTVGGRDLGVSAAVTTFTGRPEVTVANYPSNPEGTPVFSVIGKYVDVQLSSPTGVTSVEIRVYYSDADVPAGVDESTLRNP